MCVCVDDWVFSPWEVKAASPPARVQWLGFSLPCPPMAPQPRASLRIRSESYSSHVRTDAGARRQDDMTSSSSHWPYGTFPQAPSRDKAQANTVQGKGNQARRSGLLSRSENLALGESRPRAPRNSTLGAQREGADGPRAWLEPWLLAKPAMVHVYPHADISRMTLAWPLFPHGPP